MTSSSRLCRPSLWAVRSLQVTCLAWLMLPPCGQQLLNSSAWLWLPFGSSAVVYLILPSIHYFQHHSTLSMTVSSPTNHSNCCSSVPQFSRKPASSNQHLSSEEIWKPTGQPGWPRRHQWGTWMFFFPTHSLCFALFLLRLNLSSYCGRLRVLCNFIIQYLNKAQESSQPAEDQI